VSIVNHYDVIGL